MVAKKALKSIIKNDPATDEVLSSEHWSKDTCSLCQVECPTREMKVAHFKSRRHVCKSAVAKFLADDIPPNAILKGRPSKLAERYKDREHDGIGLETIYELIFPFAESGWWACTICYDVGFNYDQLDEHLDSAKHLQQFLDEMHLSKSKKMAKDWSQTERLEYLLDAKKQIHFEYKKNGKQIAPDEIVQLNWTLQATRKRLMVNDMQSEYTVHPVSNDSSNVIILCQTCSEVIPCRKDYVVEAWLKHKTFERHRRLVGVNAILRQYHFERVAEEERLLSELKEEVVRWKKVDDRVYGPVCGIKHLARMGLLYWVVAAYWFHCDTALCTLCGVMAQAVDEHFSSESHLIRFMCTQCPRDAWSMMQASKEERRDKLLAMIQTVPRENEESRATKEACPGRVTWLAVECESEQLPHFPPPQEQFGMDASSFSVFCGTCWLVLPIPPDEKVNSVWNEHVVSFDHLDYAARRNTIEYDDSYIVPLESTVPLLPKDPHGKWITESVGEQVTWKYQEQTDVGLEYVVEDADLGIAVCTLCARSYSLGESCQMGRHVRSMQHLMQYMHVSDRLMLKWVMDEKKELVADDIMLDYIVKNRVSAYDFIRVHSKKKTKELESWPNIKIRTVIREFCLFFEILMQLTSLTSELRPTYDCVYSLIDKVANDKDEQRTVSAREALTIAGMIEIPVTKSLLQNTGLTLFRCKACYLCFVTHPSQLEVDVWEKHISSEDHIRRATKFAEHMFVQKYFTPLSSTYTVKPFVQKDPTKKVTWRWNALDKSHDLVLAIVGLEELVEIKSTESMMIANNSDCENFTAHFMCRVCAVVVGRRAQLLEDHVRSTSHVFNYVNKHYPQTILELERLDNNDGGKERRKILATLLKDIKPPAEYCIPVYDPVGETDRRVSEAAVKAKQRDAMKKNEEMRKQAMEERKKRDEEKRKQKEIESKKEQEREEERRKREQVVMAKAAALAVERERVRKLEIEREQMAAIARKKEEIARTQNQLTRDPAIAALLQTRNTLTATLEQLRSAKAAGAVPEPRLVIPGPNQLASVPTSLSSMQPLAPTAAAPQGAMPGSMIQQPLPIMAMPPPGLMNPFSIPPPGMMAAPPPGMNSFTMPPPSMMGVGGAPPPSGPLPLMSIPPPSLVTSMAVPPPSSSSSLPGGGMMDLVGPKPVLSTFVPKVDAMPVYPSQGGSIGGLGAFKKPDFVRPSLAGAQPDMYVTNPGIITNRQALVDYMMCTRCSVFERFFTLLGVVMVKKTDEKEFSGLNECICSVWKQGNEETPETERPARFSRLCAATPACLGMEYIYEVVCLDSADLTTMYCSMCGYWSTPMDTVKHMLTSSHRLLYLFRNYKLYHKTVEAERDQRTKEILLEQFAMQIRSRDNPPPCVTHRLKCYLNAAAIQRLWPQYVTILDQSWRTNPVCRTPSPKRRRSRSRSYDSRSNSRSYSRSRSRSPDDRYRRSRSRDRDYDRKRRSSRSRSRSRSLSRRGRDNRRRSYSRSRSDTPVNKTWQPEAMAPTASLSPVPPSVNGANGPMMGMRGVPGTNFGGLGPVNTSVPPPSFGMITPNMSVPPPIIASPMSQHTTPVKQPTVVTLDDDEMQISTTPPNSAEKKEKEREKERERERDAKREKESKKERSRSRERSRRDSGRRERDRKKDEVVDPVREEQARRVMEKIKEKEKEKREQKEKEKEREREKRKEAEDRMRRFQGSSHRSSNGGGSGGGGGGEVIDWDSKAAAFLAKIGDLQGASKLIQGGGSSSQAAASSSPYGTGPPVYNGAPTAAAAAARPGSGMGGASYSPLPDSLSSLLTSAAAKKRKEISSPDYEPIGDEGSGNDFSAPAPSKAAAAAPSAEDEEKKRKLLGVIVTMQQENQKGRDLSEKDLDRLYAEIGLNRGVHNDKLIAELIEQIGGRPAEITPRINLQEYGIGLPSSSPAQHHDSPYYGASSSRGAPPPGYGSRDPRAPPSTARGVSEQLDEGDIELLRNVKSTLALMRNLAPAPSGPRSLPMPPGFGGERPYDRREPYAPPSSAYPPYRSPAEEDPRLRRPMYDDLRGGDPYRGDPRADPRVDSYARDPRADPRYALDPRDPRYRGYNDDPYGDRGRPPPQQQQPPGYGSPYDRDMRPAMRDPRDPRDPYAPPPPSAQPRPSVDPNLYKPPPRPAEQRPVLTREEYEARLRGEFPATQPTGSAQPKPAAAAAAAAPPAAAPPPAKKKGVATIDEDDDWGMLEELLGKAKGGVAAAAAPAAPAAGGKKPLLVCISNVPSPSNGTPPTAAGGAAAAPALTAAEAAKEAGKQHYMERQAAVRQHWGVRNRAAPAPQPHLGAPGPALEAIGFDSPQTRAAEPPLQQQYQQSLQMPPGL
ncbi:hypothetical protein PRIPAC_92887 [Pristionchus pacificus]|uniref:Uncharacterized protein n=1 Tax=Pristionchus pacificus TaxID=54126 RepID=A0A2A6B9S8_PRIPA|nr:hypothetical protein PRIPAC_92887 [Pristionchus pacificus]|eukprot:PDM62642.1 hypothetical protein PRIPAC_49857 [Pristionchus pacificus]